MKASRFHPHAFWGLMVACALAAPAWAEVTPQPGPGDPHLQYVHYDPTEVVALHAANGYAVTVQFSPEERIETVTLGDTSGWAVQVNRRADHLVVKPVSPQYPTNLTVITDQRAYNFTLYSAVPGVGVQPYLVCFTYAQPPQDQTAPTPVTRGTYRLRGARALWPLELVDDGAFTRIRWSSAGPQPAVYRDDGKRGLALVNGVMKDGVYVIEGVAQHLVFVLGRAKASADRQTAGDPP